MKQQWWTILLAISALSFAACGDSSDGGGSDAECGNGIVEVGETCDDQNTDDGDGCSATCAVEPGFGCTGQPSTCEPAAECPTDCSELNDGCTVGVCDAGSCVARPADDGTACDDGSLCTNDDVCTAGVCGGVELDCSERDSGCTTGVCDPETGACVDTVAEDGASCDDGNACTDGDVCTAGVCGGAALDCSDLDGPCSAGVCDPEAGCVAQPLDDGTTCDDESLCTSNDMCVAGACVGDAVECPDAGTCGTGICDPETGSCGIDPAPDGTACDDGSVCTDDEACLAGACVGTLPDCSAFDGICSIGVCDPESGECGEEPLMDGTACDDGSLCTDDEACLAGSCVGTQPDCTAFDGEDTCTVGACNPETGACEAAPADDGIVCDDGDLCTLDDICSGGACTGRQLDCRSSGSACAVGFCNSATGECETDVFDDGTDCDDGNVCTTGDSCVSGACEGEATDCSELDTACTAGFCDPITGGCLSIPVAEDTPCDTDPNDCSLDVCRAGACVPTPIEDFRSCDTDPNDCMNETCRDGACQADPVADCQRCGEDGLGLCGGGVCGGQRTDANVGFERGVIAEPFASIGDRSWTVVVSPVFSGNFAARSSTIGAFQRSVLAGDVTVDAMTELSFQLRTQFEDAEELVVYLNGEESTSYTATQDYTRESVMLQPGRNIVEFSFERGATTSIDNGVVWIDDIQFEDYDPCASDICSAEVYNGASCILCSLADEGTSCDDDAFDCVDLSCDGIGTCVADSRADCDGCGEAGDDYCVSGVCGGVPGEIVYNFDEEMPVFPAEFVATGPSWTIAQPGFSGVNAIGPTGVGIDDTARLSWTVNLEEPGVLSYWWTAFGVASESSLLVNGVAVRTTAGAFDWQRIEQSLPPGSSVVEWVLDNSPGDAGVGAPLLIDDIQIVGVDVCTDDTDCTVDLYDGEVCLVCPVPDPLCIDDGDV